MLRKREIELPMVEEINDRSKSDILIEALVPIQVFWFIVQCIARASQSLHVTKIEILSIAYITTNLWMYAVFWDKPRNTTQPIRIPRTMQPPQRGFFRPKYAKEGWLRTTSALIFASQNEDFPKLRNLTKVPMFYSGNPKDNQSFGGWFFSWVIGGIFSTILSITWSYESSSSTELIMWRLCAVIGFPFFIITVLFSFLYTELWKIDLKGRGVTSDWSDLAIGFIASLLMPLYVAARVATILLAFWELRDPPAGTYEVVNWTDFLPHI